LKRSKIYTALEYLSVYELNSFYKFVNSPYFNQNERILKYFNYLLPFLKGKKRGDISKYDIWDKIEPGTRYDDDKFRKYTSDLLRLFERFLAQQIYEQNNLNIANNLLENISKKKILKLYNSVLSTAERLSKRHIDRNSDYYYYQYGFEKNKFNLTSEFEKKSKKKKKFNWLNIAEMGENLDVFYIAEKLKLYSTLLSWKRVYKLDIELNFIEEIIGFVDRIEYENYPPIAIWYQIYLTTFDNENIDHYYKLKILIDRYISSFPKEEAQDIYESALNYCIRKANTGHFEFYHELLTLYQDLLQNDMLIEDNHISPTRFRNIVFVATKVEDFEWAEQFIDKFKNKLDEIYRESAVAYNLARLYFFKEDFYKVIEYLRDVEFDDVVYELGSKNMLIKTYYELEEITPLFSLLDSFNVFLNRQKRTIPDNRRKNYKLLIKYVKKLLNSSYMDKIGLKKIKNEIEQAGNFPDKRWVLEKFEEMVKR